MGLIPGVELRGAHAAFLNARLLSWELVDAAGAESDQLTLRVDISGQSGLPKKGERVGISVGYVGSGLVDKGEFLITRARPTLFPATMNIVATAAPFQVVSDSDFKLRRSRSFEKISLGDLFRQLVSPHGFSPRVDPALDSLVLDHVDQSDETDMALVTRLARRHDAVAKPVGALYVLARRGQVKSFSGQPVSTVGFSVPGDNSPGSAFVNAQVDFADRDQFSGVRAEYWDAQKTAVVQIESGELPFKKLRQQYSTQEAAQAAVDGEMRRLKREGSKLKLDVPGDPGLVAEGLVRLDATWPDYVQGDWSIDRVISTGARGAGYRCSVSASVPV